MSLLLTRNCHYAILVAIEDGRNFPARDDREVFITSRLNLKLPRPVDDLIPPNTRITTRPTPFKHNPHWRTTLVYYVSKQILSRLKKRQAEITLEISTVSEEFKVDTLGSVILKVDLAKLVVMHQGDKELSQIQQFVVDKGDWHSLSENTRIQVKAGLFIVEMPHFADPADKEVATPLQMPMKTSSSTPTSGELGLEIRSDISDLLMLPEEDDSYLQEEEEDSYYQESCPDEHMEDTYELNNFFQIGQGNDHYKVIFRVISAQNISPLVEHYHNIRRMFFRCVFGQKQYEWDAYMHKNQWIAKENYVSLNLQGHVTDIIEWVNRQWRPLVQLIIEYMNGAERTEIIAYSEIQLTDPIIAKNQQCNIIYDRNKAWYINSDNQFAQLQSQFGLIEGWKESHVLKPILYK